MKPNIYAVELIDEIENIIEKRLERMLFCFDKFGNSFEDYNREKYKREVIKDIKKLLDENETTGHKCLEVVKDSKKNIGDKYLKVKTYLRGYKNLNNNSKSIYINFKAKFKNIQIRDNSEKFLKRYLSKMFVDYRYDGVMRYYNIEDASPSDILDFLITFNDYYDLVLVE